MAPNSPLTTHSSHRPPQPTAAASPTLVSGSISRTVLSLPRNASAGPSTLKKLPELRSSAEAYAHANRRDKEKEKGGSKPIFEWISRKLGAGRRATLGDIVPTGGNLPTPQRLTVSTLPTKRQSGRELPAEQIFPQSTSPPDRSASIARTESHSLRSYAPYANSERRRENNPYPSLPVPRAHRTSTIDTESAAFSTSFVNRSRTPSLRSESSDSNVFRIRWSVADDGSSYRPGRHADEDASLRPIPPSPEPEPSNSYISRSASASASLLSPYVGSDHRPPSPPFRRSETRYSTASSGGLDPSISSSDPDELNGRQSRRDSASTKPTTVISFDSGPHIAHIAQAPSPSSPLRTYFAPSAPSSPFLPGPGPSPTVTPQVPPGRVTTTTPATPPSAQAPKHTAPHPRDNPNPTAIPAANASTLTLASSTFAVPAISSHPHTPAPLVLYRIRDTASPSSLSVRPSSLAASPSVTFAPGVERPNSYYEAQYPSSTHAISLHGTTGTRGTGQWGYGQGKSDDMASVRALRRKGSSDSNESGWSWKAGVLPLDGTPGSGFSGIYPGLSRYQASLSPLDMPDTDQSAPGSQTGPDPPSLTTQDSYVTARSHQPVSGNVSADWGGETPAASTVPRFDLAETVDVRG